MLLLRPISMSSCCWLSRRAGISGSGLALGVRFAAPCLWPFAFGWRGGPVRSRSLSITPEWRVGLWYGSCISVRNREALGNTWRSGDIGRDRSGEAIDAGNLGRPSGFPRSGSGFPYYLSPRGSFRSCWPSPAHNPPEKHNIPRRNSRFLFVRLAR